MRSTCAFFLSVLAITSSLSSAAPVFGDLSSMGGPGMPAGLPPSSMDPSRMPDGFPPPSMDPYGMPEGFPPTSIDRSGIMDDSMGMDPPHTSMDEGAHMPSVSGPSSGSHLRKRNVIASKYFGGIAPVAPIMGAGKYFAGIGGKVGGGFIPGPAIIPPRVFPRPMQGFMPAHQGHFGGKGVMPFRSPMIAKQGIFKRSLTSSSVTSARSTEKLGKRALRDGFLAMNHETRNLGGVPDPIDPFHDRHLGFGYGLGYQEYQPPAWKKK